jgi:hypothetical protein
VIVILLACSNFLPDTSSLVYTQIWCVICDDLWSASSMCGALSLDHVLHEVMWLVPCASCLFAVCRPTELMELCMLL